MQSIISLCLPRNFEESSINTSFSTWPLCPYVQWVVFMCFHAERTNIIATCLKRLSLEEGKRQTKNRRKNPIGEYRGYRLVWTVNILCLTKGTDAPLRLHSVWAAMDKIPESQQKHQCKHHGYRSHRTNSFACFWTRWSRPRSKVAPPCRDMLFL